MSADGCTQPRGVADVCHTPGRDHYALSLMCRMILEIARLDIEPLNPKQHFDLCYGFGLGVWVAGAPLPFSTIPFRIHVMRSAKDLRGTFSTGGGDGSFVFWDKETRPGVARAVSGRKAREWHFVNKFFARLVPSGRLSFRERGFVRAGSRRVVCEPCLSHP